jgi:hypothetical protein
MLGWQLAVNTLPDEAFNDLVAYDQSGVLRFIMVSLTGNETE